MPHSTYNIFGRLSLVILVIALCSSCNDVFEEDISDQNVALISPSDGFVSNSASLVLRWEELSDAYQYQVQVSSPDFNNPDVIEVDSLLFSEEISVALQIGIYQWRVRGVNAESETVWTTREFEVSDSGGLADETPVLLSPDESAYMNQTSVNFDWEEVVGADFYQWTLFEDNQGAPGSEEELELLETTTFTSDIAEGTWWWRVRGFSDLGGISNFAQQKFTIDLTAPSIPELEYPLDDQLVLTVDTLRWVYGTDLNPAYDSLFVSSSSGFEESLIALEIVLDEHPIDFQTWDSGVYYWKVLTFDLAGNFTPSQINSFLVP